MNCSTPQSNLDVLLAPVPRPSRCRAMTHMSRWWDKGMLSCLPFMELTMSLGLMTALCVWMALN
nr:hypothetical protein [Roseovarius sp. W115]